MQVGKQKSFQHMVLKQPDSHMEKKKKDSIPYLIPHRRWNSHQPKHKNERPKTSRKKQRRLSSWLKGRQKNLSHKNNNHKTNKQKNPEENIHKTSKKKFYHTYS